MAICESVKRTIRVRGSCSEWLPVVQGSLSAHGCRRIAVDESVRRLSADFGDTPVAGSVSVSLSPAAGGDTDVIVMATAALPDTSGLVKRGGVSL